MNKVTDKAQPSVRPYRIPRSLVPRCRNCPRGAGLSLTVFFFGIGERSGLNTSVRYTREESMFPRALAAALVRGPHECCRTELLLVKHDSTATIAENAAAAAAQIERAITRAVCTYEWLLKINLHLVGFSAGGLLALDTASRINVNPRVRSAALCGGSTPLSLPVMWCGNEMPLEIPLEMDLVTMATPYNLDITLASTLVSGMPWTYESSVGASEYRAPAPEKLCSFTALVSSASHGDTSAGADCDPDPPDTADKDPRLRALLSGLSPTKQRVELLKNTYRPSDPDDDSDPQHVSHVQVAQRVLEDFAWALVPRCDCVRTF